MSQQEIPPLIRGVFAYLDGVLTVDQLRVLSTLDIDVGLATKGWGGVRSQVAEKIRNEYRLMYWGSQLRAVLDGYQLYHEDDMSDALACAYGLYRRGMDPNEALRADYCITGRGVLYWISLDELCAERYATLRARTSHLYREGDRFAHYLTGAMMVRGDRLVHEVSLQTMHINVDGISRRFQAEMAKFEELGGTRAFLAGKLDWPPPGWVNPVRHEDDRAQYDLDSLEPLPLTGAYRPYSNKF
ncbi:MAG: hypothetical protein QM790_17475 [Nibricoccus sp.]